MKKLIPLLFTVSFALNIFAQEPSPSAPIIFIYDASGSMWGQMEGKTKMEIASQVLIKSLETLSENQQLGLVAYGHRNKGDCKDVEFLVDIESGGKTAVTQSLASIKPLGKTPLAYSSTTVINKLRTSKTQATVILLTDGIESCGGNICEVVKAAREEGIDFRLHIIGFGLKEGETNQLECAAAAGDGKYFSAANADELSNVLNEATAATVDKTNNFSVFAVKNNQPIDAYIKAYRAGTEDVVDIGRTYRDTSFLSLPAGMYDLEVNPLENSSVNPITVQNLRSYDDEVIHQTVSFDGAKLEIFTFNNTEGWDTMIKVKDKKGKTVAGGRTYGRSKTLEVNPGTYDVELTALAMNGLQTIHLLEDVTLEAGKVKTLEHQFKTGILMIGAKSGSELVDATVGIADAESKINIAGGRTYTSPNNNPRKFILNPGIYSITMRSLGRHAGKEDIFTMEIKESETVEKIIEF